MTSQTTTKHQPSFHGTQPQELYLSTTSPLIDKISYLPKDQIELVKLAVDFATHAHDGQYRRSGEPYVTHPIAVAQIIAEMKLDHYAIIAALLHDVIEDTPYTKEDIANRFSMDVANIVDGISKISAIQFESKAIAQAENFRKMVLAMAKDIRVILVKLADRLHNMRTLGCLKMEKRKRIAQETLDIFAPIANRLGMNNLRVEYEDLCFHAIHPLRAKRIHEAVKKTRGTRKDIIKLVEGEIKKALNSLKIDYKLIGREKHLFSIYSKMKNHRKPFEQIMDVFGFRIIVPDIDACYRSLGLMHQLHPPIPGRFKDYIAIPKSNGYQSVHTTLKGPNGIPVEIQIRTDEMDEVANNGVASHWIYKAGKDIALDAQRRADNWLASLMEMQKNTGDSQEFVENVKYELFPEEVYVFTPKGAIIELPYGATAIDFAYAVHTDIGNTCVAARADERLIPISAPLESGMTLEIICAPGANPNPTWLKHVTTGKARACIKHHIKTQQLTESQELGQRLLDKALNALSTSLEKIKPEHIAQACKNYGCDDLEAITAEIGLGQRMAPIVARQLIGIANDKQNQPQENSSQKPLVIDGTEGMVITFSKCCYPIPGDQILGYLSSGQGIIIHQSSCPKLYEHLRLRPDESLPVSWAESTQEVFRAGLTLEMFNKPGNLAQVTQVLAETDSNIENIVMDSKGIQLANVEMEITIKNRVHLAKIIRRIRARGVAQRITRKKVTAQPTV